jgi:hypothetical protein
LSLRLSGWFLLRDAQRQSAYANVTAFIRDGRDAPRTCLYFGDGFSKRRACQGNVASNVPGTVACIARELRCCATDEFMSTKRCCVCHTGFMQFDNDPYPVIQDGRVVYIFDGYTTTDRYPNAQRADSSGLPAGSDLGGKLDG